MTTRGHFLGHPIEWDELAKCWIYTDTRQIPEESRPCAYCNLSASPEGHDPCIGTLPGVMNACCGHGDLSSAYVQFEEGVTVRGQQALETINRLRVMPVEVSQ